MKFIILLLSSFFIFTTYASGNYKLTLNTNDLNQIKQLPNKNFIIKRFKQYRQLTKKIKEYSTIRKLSHVNTFFNRILPQLDSHKYGINDYWSTQKEFLIKGKGDCEDYVIAKYFTLIESGIPKDKLYLGIVQVKGKTSNHMVLLYFENSESIPLVMDNLSFKVVGLDIRKRLIKKVIFNEYGSHFIQNNRLGKKATINWKGNNKWDKILTRVYVNNE